MANLGASGIDFNGEIILTSNGAGGFKFVDSNDSTLMSKTTITNDISSLAVKDETHDSDVSSLAADISGGNEELNSDISSLAVKDETHDSDVSSLAADVTSEQEQRDSDVSSLAADISGGNEELNSDVSSLHAKQSNNTVITAKVALSQGDSAKSTTWADDNGDGFTFGSAPSVVAVLRNIENDAVIIPVMVSEATTTGCTVVFADGMPSNDYVLEIIASA